MKPFDILKSLGLLVGMIIGAGMFALPYAVAHAGMWWAGFHFILAALLMTAVHILYGDVYYSESLHHRLPGLVDARLGARWYWVALLSRFFSYFGYQLAYGVLAGVFLSTLFPGRSEIFFAVGFFIAASPILYLNVKNAGVVNLILTVPLVLFVFILLWGAFPKLNLASIAGEASGSNWFLPYGIFLFAFSGASIIPEVADLFRRRNKRLFRATVIGGTVLVALVYIAFIAAILAITGGVVNADSLSSLALFAPWPVVALGAVIGFLAIITSYIALGLELRYTFEYDVNTGRLIASELVAYIPLMLYLLGINNFAAIISVVGAIGVGIEGILIAVLSRRVSGTNIFFISILVSAFVLGAAFGIFQSLGVI